MAVTQFITHQFSKSKNAKTDVKLRDSVMPGSEELDLFCQELKYALHRRAGRDYGCFLEKDEQAVLPQKLINLLNGEINFVAMSVQWMHALQESLNSLEDIDVAGHVVFMQEEHLGHEMFYVFIVSLKESLMINNKLEVEQLRFADMGSSLMAARVELSIWQAKASQSYLTIATPRSKTPWIEEFRALCGFCTTVDKQLETKNFLQTVVNFSRDIPKESVQQFKTQIVDYCLEQDKIGEAVEKAELGSVINNIDGVDKDTFSKAFNSKEKSVDAKIHIDRNSLRKFMRFTGRERELTISFTSDQLQNRIHYNQEKDVLTINGVPKTLREQLLASGKS